MTAFLIFIATVFLILGFFKPQTSLFWYTKERTTALSTVIYGGILTVFVFFIAPVNKESPLRSNSLPSATADTVLKTDSNTTVTPVVTEDPAKIAEDRVKLKLKARAERDWPNDYTTQEYWINQELEDYQYMLTIADGPVKTQAERDWPYDYTTQKFWYDQQVEARERLNSQ